MEDGNEDAYFEDMIDVDDQDRLIFKDRSRQNMDTTRAMSMRRKNVEEFQLCPECPENAKKYKSCYKTHYEMKSQTP